MEKKDTVDVWSGKLPFGFWAETIYDPASGFQLVVHNPADGTVEILPTFDSGATLYVPCKMNLVEKGVVVLPSGVSEYASDEQLYQDILTFIDRWVFLGDSPAAQRYLRLVALYVQLTWIYEQVKTLPYLRVLGPPGSGKTRFLEVVGSLCYRTTRVSGCATSAALFRMIDLIQGTLAIDETDFNKSDLWADVVKVLNEGYRTGGYVIRNVGERANYKTTAFRVFCPKLLAARRRFQDEALESRCFTHEMPRGHGGRSLYLTKLFEEEAKTLRAKLLLWRLRRLSQEWTWDERLLPPALEPRLGEIGLSLIQLTTSEEIREVVRQTLLEYQQELREERGTSLEAEVIQRIVEVCSEKRTVAKEQGKTGLLNRFPTIGGVTDRINAGLGEHDVKHDHRKIGALIRNHLYLKTQRLGGGTVIVFDGKQLAHLVEKYGIQTNEPLGEDGVDGEVQGEGENDPVPAV